MPDTRSSPSARSLADTPAAPSQGPRNAALLHALAAIVWSGLAGYLGSRYLLSAEATPELMTWLVRILRAWGVLLLGLVLIQFSWLRLDATQRQRGMGSAALVALLAPPTMGLAPLLYLLATRQGLRQIAAAAAGYLLSYAACAIALLQAVQLTV